MLKTSFFILFMPQWSSVQTTLMTGLSSSVGWPYSRLTVKMMLNSISYKSSYKRNYIFIHASFRNHSKCSSIELELYGIICFQWTSLIILYQQESNGMSKKSADIYTYCFSSWRQESVNDILSMFLNYVHLWMLGWLISSAPSALVCTSLDVLLLSTCLAKIATLMLKAAWFIWFSMLC